MQGTSLFYNFTKNQQTTGTGATNRGRVLNPIIGWRKVTANIPSEGCPCNNIKNQEVFSNSTSVKQESDYCNQNNGNCNNGCCPARIRKNQPSPTTKKNRTYHYDYRQYLRRKCKTFKQKSFHYDIDTNNRGRTQCSTKTLCSCKDVYYKPNNKQYDKQGAVSSSERLLRLKTKMKQRCQCWTSKTYPSSNCICHAGRNTASCCKL
tara:strand:- start:298 stop:915 length:618 start_codon:yes stop_codon:yes gene_type:complete